MTLGDLERSFSSVDGLLAALHGLGCEQALVKVLAANQDNEKNQINLGGSPAIMDFFPGVTTISGESTSTEKIHSDVGQPIPKLELNFAWIWPDGTVHPAPRAGLIYYRQYPEVRLSGFLHRCDRAPKAVRRDDMDEYGQRILVLGIAGERVFGTVVTDVDGRAVLSQLSTCADWPVSTLLKVLQIPESTSSFNRSALEREVTALFGLEHPACELKNVEEGPRAARSGRGHGLTLEALLGIPQNGRSGPDKHGFEVKAVRGKKVTMITTEPDLGYRAGHGVGMYLAKFGWEAPTKPGRRVFNGQHKYGEVGKRSHAMLSIANWDSALNLPTWRDDPQVQLIHTPTGELISGWSYDRIKSQWSKKHSGAIYVEATAITKDEQPFPSHYIFGPRYLIGIGTSALYFLEQLAARRIFFDPADELKTDGDLTSRTQWRVQGSIRTASAPVWKPTQLPHRLSFLYDALDVIDDDGSDGLIRLQRGSIVPS